MEKLFRFLFVVFGSLLGFQGASLAVNLGLPTDFLDARYFSALFVSGGALLGLSFGPVIMRGLYASASRLLQTLHKTPMSDVLSGAVGLVIGLLIAILITIPLPREVPVVGEYLPVIITLLVGYIGLSIGLRKREEMFSMVFKSDNRNPLRDKRSGASPKILDTSVIIDGRIADITKSGFIEGPLIIPGFVLEELQHIADSSDVLKRNRGRRGLDILNKIQKEPYVAVQIYEKDFEEISEVDSKLVKLAKHLTGRVITNDFNLNKVCELQGIPVLNINELANAVKPVVLPGEELKVHVIKDGKEQGQGVAYLDDGTMIVVDGGRRFIGETVGVLVTSVLQTAAGRMIFAKPKAMERAL